MYIFIYLLLCVIKFLEFPYLPTPTDWVDMYMIVIVFDKIFEVSEISFVEIYTYLIFFHFCDHFPN